MLIQQLLQLGIERGASDIHLIVGYPPSIRVDGELFQIKILPIITKEVMEQMIFSIISSELKENLLANKEIDFAYEYNNTRFRVNIYYAKGALNGVFRLISSKIRTIEDLALPASFYKFVDMNEGLILVTGPTGEGKSTTLAAILNEINLKHSKNIITVEDPVEYVYPKGSSIVSQREMHNDTHSWNIALRSMLREDPDVVLIGEMRDFETIQLALTIAETGHLVFSTLHTSSAPETINRIIDSFPPHQQNQIRTQLSSVLKVVVTQRLLPRLDQKGRVAALEILYNIPAVAAIIREGKPFLLDNVLETSQSEGLVLFEKYLVALFQQGKISKETAYAFAIRPRELEKFLK